MSKHLFGAIVTHHGAAANNRGETEGNITTLQKLMWNDDVHTTVSAEAIRWAVRYRWQTEGLPVRRKWDDDADDYDESTNFDPTEHIDDDVMGFMLAEGAKVEGNPAERSGRAKGTTTKRRGVLEVTRAISLSPFGGDITFNAKAGEKGSTSLYGTEVHATRYQYGFALTPDRLKKKSRATQALHAMVALGEVGGNHSRFLFDFSPEALVLRWTDDPSPRMLYCFKEQDGKLRAPKLSRAIKSGDIPAEELVVGGILADTEFGSMVEDQGGRVVQGVREANEIMASMMSDAK